MVKNISEARQVVSEFGIEQGARFEYAADRDTMGKDMVVKIVDVRSTGQGVREIDIETFVDGESVSVKTHGVSRVAQEIETGWYGERLDESTEDTDDEKELVTDGGKVVDKETTEDYPKEADVNERLVGSDEWGGWYYDGVEQRLHNYKLADGPEEVVLDETEGACEKLTGQELAERIGELDTITAHGYQTMHSHAPMLAPIVVNALQRHGLTPAQAWSYYGVKLLGHSRNKWAKEMGHSDHSAVAQAVRKAEAKVPK